MSPGPILSAFRDHWQGLRRPFEVAPLFSRFLDRANPATAPYTYIVETEQRQQRVILFGTGISEVYGRDLTGSSVAEMLPEPALRAISVGLRRMSSVQCGLLVACGFIGRGNLPMRGTYLMLPLLRKAGEIVIAGAAEFAYDMNSRGSVVGSGRVIVSQWIDIGSETPG